MGINWWGTITNEEVLSRAGSRSLFQTLKIRRMRLVGHLRRMPDGRLAKDILYTELCTGLRPRGRPMLRFKYVAKRVLVSLDIDTERWEEFAEDRTGWRNALRKGGEALEARWLEKLRYKDYPCDTNTVLCKSLEDCLPYIKTILFFPAVTIREMCIAL